MCADVLRLQAQVESVLGALVRAATVELTKLFESTYLASAAVNGLRAGRAEVKGENDVSQTPDSLWTADNKRSIGVQVDEGVDPLLCLEVSGPPSLSGDESVGQCGGEEEEEEEEEGSWGLIPSEILLAGDNGLLDPEWSPLKKQVLPESADLGETTNTDALTEDVLPEPSTLSSPVRHKPLIIQPDTSGASVKFVCPLILKPETTAPTPDSLMKPVRAEPQQAVVSTAGGAADSPSPTDGAVTPVHVGVWERVNTPIETKNNLHMKLKLTSPDRKLLSPCVVQLVNVLTASDSKTKLHAGAENSKTCCHLPKDLRPHQGLHTGHRICCFTQCETGVWRLQKVVAHSRAGYTCSTCQKTFKHRKILRRHERFHTGEKPYPCSQCSKTFALRKSLRRHMRFHTGERPHTCAQCGKSFRLRDNLKAHLRFHSGEKPFSCSTCGKMFRILRNLENHRLSQCEVFVPSFRMIAGL